MKKVLLSGLSLTLVTILTWAILAQTRKKQVDAAGAANSLRGCQLAFFAEKSETLDQAGTRHKRQAEASERFSQEPAVQTLVQMQSVNENAILEAGDDGDKSVVPYLEFLADESKNSDAFIALIRMGDEARLEKLIAQTQYVEGVFDEKDYSKQIRAIKLLAQVKTPAAYRALYKFLDDTERPASAPNADYINPSRSQVLIRQLSEIVKPLPAELSQDEKTGRWPSENQVRMIWKQWFEANNFVPY